MSLHLSRRKLKLCGVSIKVVGKEKESGQRRKMKVTLEQIFQRSHKSTMS